MLRRRTRIRGKVFSGFSRFAGAQSTRLSAGFEDGNYVRLKDEQGNVWRGTAEVLEDNSVHYRFRNVDGKVISGMSDGYGMLLRDERGKIWRGYIF